MMTLLISPGQYFAFGCLPLLGSVSFDVALESLRPVASLFSSLFRTSAAAQIESPEDRLANVAQVRISPGKFVGYQGQIINFSALGSNLSGQTIQGVKFRWASSNPDKLEIDDTGKARLINPGLAWVTCRAGLAQSTAPVLVRPGERPAQSDGEWRADQLSLNEDGSAATNNAPGPSAGLLPSLLDKLLPTAHAQSCGSGGDGGDVVYDELWNEPRNLVGSPHNRAIEPTRNGPILPEGSNFNMAIPLISLGGRGLAANLMLYYNSRVWSQHGSAITFNAVNGWPFAGFSLGFGRVITYDTSPQFPNVTKYMLVEPDGTRRLLGSAPSTGTNTLETSDGTHIRYVGNTSSGELRFPDGTRVTISTVNNRLLPTQIKNPNGNYIQIAYKTGFAWKQAIDYVTDTLGRVIQFHYDSCASLTKITAPALGGSSQNPLTRTMAEFDYQDRSLGFTFSGLSVENATSGQTLKTLRHIFFPTTQTGYLFSYGDYGMIHNASIRRQMSIDTNGVISDGVESASVSFNYPTSGSTTLTAAPAFTQRTETPGGSYTYSSADDAVAQTKTFTISRPDLSQLLLTRSTNTASVSNGLMVQSEIKKSGNSMAKEAHTYANDPGGSPQLESVTSFDDAGTPTKTDFSYNSKGAVLKVRDYGHQVSGAWQVRRRVQYSYKSDSDSNYLNDNLWRLVTQVSTFDALLNTNEADDVEIEKTTFTYDNYAAMGGMQNYGGFIITPGHDPNYNTNRTRRGNVTGRTEWVDISAGTTITRLAKFDIFGNVVRAQVSCCNERSLTFDSSNSWSRPVQTTNGSQSGLNLTSSTAYDFNTLAVTSETDPNNLTTSFNYDAILRPTSTMYVTGATGSVTYNDDALSVSSSLSFTEGGTSKFVTGSAVYDGWGRVKESINNHNGQVNISYDAIGRVSARTNPFTAGGSPGPSTTYQYDGLGRVTTVTFPDNNTVTYQYSGVTVTTTDQVNRKKKSEVDGLGRIVKITEQNSGGTLSQETSYSYDLLNRLTEINQGNQTRKYKYDALGRMLFERIPEQSATINDGTGQMWSMKYTYTDFHAVATRTDARAVVTTYGYDTLNRLTTVSYNTTNAPGVASTPNVTYTYDTSTTSNTKGLLLSVAVGSNYTESYFYDAENRISELRHVIDSLTYRTNYQYNSANQVTQVQYPSQRAINITHDGRGRLKEVQGYISGIGYNDAGQVTISTLGNSTQENYGYNSRLQMTSQTAVRSGVTLMSLNYSYDALAGQNGSGSTAGNSGRLMAINNSTINGTAESASFTYDLVGRLVTSNQTTNGSSAQRRFDYDRWGNRTGVWDATSGGNQVQTVTLQQSGGVPTNRISAVNGTSYSYDAAGNVTSDGTNSYTYDAENRLANVNSGSTAQYSYDQANRRYKKVAGGSSLHYVWEGGQVIAEHNASTQAVTVEYVYAGGKMIAKEETAGRRYLLSDRLSIRLVVSTTGGVVGRQGHLPFGEDLAVSGAADKHRLTSYERDAESGQDYAVNRYHAPSIGRFNSVDKLAGNLLDPQRLNRYSYVQNDPVNKTDALGLQEDIAIILEANACSDIGLGYDAETGECVAGGGNFGVESVSGGFGDVTIEESTIPAEYYGGPFLGTGTSVGGELGEPPAEERYRPDGSRDCIGFVKFLVRLVREYRGRAFAGDRLGVQLGLWALQYERSDPTTGFKRELYDTGSGPSERQGGEAYKHILAFASLTVKAAFGDVSANILIREALQLDIAQRATGRRESIAEVNDDYAGMAVGDLLVRGLNGQISGSDLREALKRELCE